MSGSWGDCGQVSRRTLAEAYTRDYDALNQSRAQVRKSLVRDVLRSRSLSATGRSWRTRSTATTSPWCSPRWRRVLPPSSPKGCARRRTATSRSRRPHSRQHRGVAVPGAQQAAQGSRPCSAARCRSGGPSSGSRSGWRGCSPMNDRRVSGGNQRARRRKPWAARRRWRARRAATSSSRPAASSRTSRSRHGRAGRRAARRPQAPAR